MERLSLVALASLLLAGCNLPSLTDTPTPLAAIIRGTVWHDVCGPLGSEAGEPGPGCVVQPDGGYAANGEREPGEPAIEGVQVALGDGPCPSTGVGSALTGPDGSYVFIGHSAGTYCVSVDATHPTNSAILMPGEWTGGNAQSIVETTVEIAGGQDLSGIDFGWDYRLLPMPETAVATETPEPTADLHRVVASVNANCRQGPDTNYDVIGFLLQDESAEAVGRNDSSTWWQVVLPSSGLACWISDLTVEVNFNSDQLPILIAPPTPTPSPGSIRGRVWHDECAITGGEGGEPAVPSPGCLELEGGGFGANGLMEQGEPGLSGVLVYLGLGNCPSIGLAATTTGDDGEYEFVGLEVGIYCVSVDAFGAINSTILIPGGWTQPAAADSLASIMIALSDGEQPGAVNFGWDYQFLP